MVRQYCCCWQVVVFEISGAQLLEIVLPRVLVLILAGILQTTGRRTACSSAVMRSVAELYG
jgi:hypothetical protein